MNILGLSITTRSKQRRRKEDLEYYQNRYLTRSGAIRRDGAMLSYRLLSPNGGGDWYVLNESGSIVGLADNVYPGLIEQLEGLDRLIQHTAADGPLDPATSTGKRMLEEAGFTVTMQNETE